MSSILFLTLCALAVSFVLTFSPAYLQEPKQAADYAVEIKQFEVRGNSLAPLINASQTINLLYGYYNSHPIEREDIIAYDYAGNDVPIVKIAKAIPGDKWRLKKEYQQNSYQIIVNNKPLKNSEGKCYQIPESNIKMLKLYAKSYPLLPNNTYLILGNKVSGSLDATQFGLIGKGDILGKVEVCR